MCIECTQSHYACFANGGGLRCACLCDLFACRFGLLSYCKGTPNDGVKAVKAEQEEQLQPVKAAVKDEVADEPVGDQVLS